MEVINTHLLSTCTIVVSKPESPWMVS